MPNQQNVENLAKIEERMQGVKAVWVVDYRGMTVKETEKLRRSVRESGSELCVFKNSLVHIALENAGLPNIDDILAGPSAFVFATDDPVAPAKALKDFAKESKKLVLKGGIMDGEAQDTAAFEAIASLPSRDQLLGQIANSITGVASQLAIAIGAMAEGESDEEAA